MNNLGVWHILFTSNYNYFEEKDFKLKPGDNRNLRRGQKAVHIALIKCHVDGISRVGLYLTLPIGGPVDYELKLEIKLDTC